MRCGMCCTRTGWLTSFTAIRCRCYTPVKSLHTPCFTAYRMLQVLVLTGKEAGTMHKLGIGAFAGLVAQSCTYPLEVTRRRMQTHGHVDTHAGVHKVRARTAGTRRMRSRHVSAKYPCVINFDSLATDMYDMSSPDFLL